VGVEIPHVKQHFLTPADTRGHPKKQDPLRDLLRYPSKNERKPWRLREKARATTNLTERFSMTLSNNDIIGAMLALLDELARRLDPDMATAVLREHGFNVASVDELQRRLGGFRT
jgi:hypothetical protein